MKEVKLLITDLDDTIWDWLSMWYNSFSPYFERILNECAVEKKILIDNFKELHRKYHTSEVSYAYKELKCLLPKQYILFEQEKNGNLGILHQYYHDKKHSLSLYPTVKDTLEFIKSSGTQIVGFTESNIFYTQYRIKTLNIDGLFDIIYSTEDHKLPESVDKYYTEDYWKLEKTEIRKLPENFSKPNPEILQKILNECKSTINDAIYVGDKPHKDVLMANSVGLPSVFASYGHIIDNEAYGLLKLVTHWTPEEVQREIEFKQKMNNIDIKPTLEIKKFDELLLNFKFDGTTKLH